MTFTTTQCLKLTLLCTFTSVATQSESCRLVVIIHLAIFLTLTINFNLTLCTFVKHSDLNHYDVI